VSPDRSKSRYARWNGNRNPLYSDLEFLTNGVETIAMSSLEILHRSSRRDSGLKTLIASSSFNKNLEKVFASVEKKETWSNQRDGLPFEQQRPVHFCPKAAWTESGTSTNS
jgi:hypothetical protein